MSRAKWKGPFLSNKVSKITDRKVINIWSRNSTIPYSMIGKAVFIHNGKSLVKTFITREKVGYKFGEFVFTKKHTKKVLKATKKKTKK